MPTNTKPSGTIGDTQKTMTISAASFRGCNRFSPLLICIYLYIFYLVFMKDSIDGQAVKDGGSALRDAQLDH